MKSYREMLLLTVAILAGAAPIRAANPGQTGASALDVVPARMPFDTPYGPPISLRRAEAVAHAAIAEATRRGWQMNVAVVDSGANLVAFLRMDAAQLASIGIAQDKALAAVKFRRPTRYFEDAVQKSGLNYVVTLAGVVASRGGIPLIEHGAIIGAVGCSGGAGSQDEAVCSVAADVINRQ